mgnify:CR=1 FL=1
MAYQTGRRRMGGLNPAPWDEVRQGQSAPPVGPPLDTERYPDNVPLDPGRPSWGLPTDEGERELQVSDALETVYRTYPTLREYGIQVRDLRDEDSHGQLEFFGINEAGRPPTVDDEGVVIDEGNLRPETDRADEGFYAGKWNPWIELYSGVVGQDLPKAIAGDMLHHLSSKDQDGNYAENRSWAPQYQALLEQFDKTVRDTPSKFNPEVTQLEEDRRLWERRTKDDETKRSFDDYWEYSGRDAWVRGYLFPDERDEMRRQDWYTDEQIGLLDQMRSLLGGEN